MTPRSSAMTASSPSSRSAARNSARARPAEPAPADGVARALRHRPVGDEPAEVVDPRHVEHRERAAQPLDPPAVAATVQRGPVVDRVAPELALRGVGVRRHAGLQTGAGTARATSGGRRRRARRRSARRRSSRTPRSAAYARSARPLAVEADLVVEGSAGRAMLDPALDPVGLALAEGIRLVAAHRRVGVGEQPGPGRERRARLVRRAVAVGRAERQHLPPRLPRGRQPVDERVRVVVQPARREGRRMELDAGRLGC